MGSALNILAKVLHFKPMVSYIIKESIGQLFTGKVDLSKGLTLNDAYVNDTFLKNSPLALHKGFIKPTRIENLTELIYKGVNIVIDGIELVFYFKKNFTPVIDLNKEIEK